MASSDGKSVYPLKTGITNNSDEGAISQTVFRLASILKQQPTVHFAFYACLGGFVQQSG
ncbi:hypothetical protein [Photorhabdus akhurstii]|uniref:hypothetical protein n=1 Tax=Photorhabdus akhurstii TaxID=171438 RepID=UPI0015E30382